ncbi:MAG TPA: glycosyltransferase [Gemmatimonadaceae bacterium]|jgi:glycosyltransferase involved in cell wall biosynthesis|nr:glycosyltransferase [Gemmatimonadaceae bacterium]
MNRRLRILHVVENLNYGGMERLISDMARHLDATRFEMHILALGYLGHFSKGLEGFAVLHTGRPQSRLSMLYPTTLAHDIRRISPDVVHIHSGLWYKVGLAARMADVPFIVYTDHGRQVPDPWMTKVIDGLASRRTNVVVAVSQRLAEHLERFVHDRRRLRVIANGVDTEAYLPRPDDQVLRQELGIAPDAPMIGSIGRLEKVKGYEVMVEAFVKLLETWTGTPRPVLVLIGDGSERQALERAADAAGCLGAIHFLGWRSDIATCHRAFTVFTMSSHSEGTSVSLLEAMSAGLCPIVTNVGGNSAVLSDTLQHRLVASGRPDALAAAWREALANPEQRVKDAEAARQRVVQTFSLGAMVRQYESVYAEAF